MVFPFRQNIVNFHFQHGQKIRFLSFTIKHQSFIFYKQAIFILWQKSEIPFFDHVESENWQYFGETEKQYSKFFICCKVSNNLPEN